MGRHFRRLFYCLVFGTFVFYSLFFGFIFVKALELKAENSINYVHSMETTEKWHRSFIRNESCKHFSIRESLPLLLNQFSTMQKKFTWQNVSFCDNTYVFSAFCDSNTNMISIVATTTRHSLLNSTIHYQCQFYENISPYALVNTCNQTVATRKPMPENRGKRYSAAFFTCPLPVSGRPFAVSLSTDHCKVPSNILPIIYPQEQKRQFTVCVTPLNFNYSKAYELVEMIELNRILGAEHFVFYNYSTHSNVNRVLEYYKKMGIVEVLEWNLPMKVDTWPKKNEPVEIHYFAQLAALNDCLYRNMYVSKYVVFQDLDEFIIPRKQLTWTDMLQNLPKGHAAYIFRCTFFRKEWPDTETNFSGKNTAKQYKLNTLLKQSRESTILGKTHRAKYIVDPTKIDTVGIHNIWRFRSGNAAHFVDPAFARMHHYRNWQNPGDSKSGIHDDKIMTYRDQLLSNTIHIWEALKNVPLGNDS